jgi:Uri superfamily endonuclease
MKGIYYLVIFLSAKHRIAIGKKTFVFPRGYYCYVGSAQNSLEARIGRHLRTEKKLHWHIDYFLKHAKMVCVLVRENSKNECGAGRILLEAGGKNVAKGFGSSDCKCQAHLYYFENKPSRRVFSNFSPLNTKSFK